jgi:uncharacterized protein YjbJ (UPF0337 family)
MGDEEEPSGFMEFAQGWNQTVKGWYHEAAGNVEAAYGYVTSDDQTMVEGIVENAEGNAQAERGENMMAGGISEMLGLVDHGDPNAGAGGGAPSSGGGSGGAGGGYSDAGADQSGVSDGSW